MKESGWHNLNQGVWQMAVIRQKYVRCYNFSDLCDSEIIEVENI
jgi:hypothetical protein